MTKIAIVGCGGIGSWLVDRIHWLTVQQQIELETHGYDDDTVELKNTIYQLFDAVLDLHEKKAMALDTRYDIEDKRWFFGHVERVLSADMFKEYDLVISAVDNLQFRKLMYEKCECDWIDLRSEGRTIMAITKHRANTPEVLASLVDGNLEENGSCQLQADLDAGRIQLGNQIIANIGAQFILNWSRGDINPAKFIHLF